MLSHGYTAGDVVLRSLQEEKLTVEMKEIRPRRMEKRGGGLAKAADH
jgi:hypothetical protein